MATDLEFMDHRYIEEHNLADRYLLGKLPAAERARFEEHFVDCPQCIELLETTESFRSGLQSVAAEEAARASVYVRAGLLAWLVRLSRGRQTLLLLSAGLLLVALPAALFVTEMRRVRGELAQAKLAAAEWQQQSGAKQQTAQKLEKELQEAERKLTEQRQQFEIQLAREQRERAPVITLMNKPGQLYSSATSFTLNSVRSADPFQSASVNDIVLSPTSPAIVLSLELETDPAIQSYRATLITVDKRLVWQKDKLQLNPKGTLEPVFNARLFQAGDYLLTLEGLTRQGQYVTVAKYPFRVSEK